MDSRRNCIKILLVLSFVFLTSAASAAVNMQEYVVLGARSFERIIVAIGGIISLVLGYKLFRVSVDLGSLSAEVPNKIKLQMQSIGPGVFFAFFGTAVLIFIINSNIELTKPEGGSFVFAGPTAPPIESTELAEVTAQSFSLIKTYAISAFPRDPVAQSSFKDAISVVDKHISHYVDLRFGEGSFLFWSITRQQAESDSGVLGKLTQQQQDLYQDINAIMDPEL